MSATDDRGGFPPAAHVRARLAAIGFRPSRRLGQNFMLDATLAAAIVRDSGVAEGDRVLEIGAGPGILTHALLAAGARVTAVDIDARLLELARENCAGRGEISWIVTDALAGKQALAPEVLAALPPVGDPWHLVANLPYSISAPLLAILAARGAGAPRTMTCLVQAEVAERICALPGEREWGPLAIGIALVYAARRGRRVPPESFWPRPKVESTVCQLLPLADPWPSERAAAVRALARVMWTRRRQTVRRFVAERIGAAADGLLTACAVDGASRPETLDLSALDRLARALPPDPGSRGEDFSSFR